MKLFILLTGLLVAASASAFSSLNVRPLPGFANPGAVTRHGNHLYVGNNRDNTVNLVTVVDVSEPGKERIIKEISTPVDPVDLKVARENLYVIDASRDRLHIQSLGGGSWRSIPLKPGVKEWSYGSELFLHGDYAFVPHPSLNTIDVIDLAAERLATTLTDLDHHPNALAFSGDTMLVLGNGLDAISCKASGPNLTAFSLTSYEKIYRKDIRGQCWLTLVADRGKAWIVSPDKIEAIETLSGKTLETLAPGGGRHVAYHCGNLLLSQKNAELVSLHDLGTKAVTGPFDLLRGQPTIWLPATEQAVTLPDGRLFVTNRNNDELSIVDSGLACPSSGGRVGH